MRWLNWLIERWQGRGLPEHLRRGVLGEAAARRHLEQAGLKFLVANYRSARGEIDLVFRDADCLVFVSFTRNIVRDNFSPANEAKTGNQLRPVQHHRTARW